MESKGRSIGHEKKLGKMEQYTKKYYFAPVLTVYGGLKEITGAIARGQFQDLMLDSFQLKRWYMAFNLSTHSSLSLPELRLNHSKPDVLIRMDKIDPILMDIVYEENDFKISKDGVVLRWE